MNVRLLGLVLAPLVLLAGCQHEDEEPDQPLIGAAAIEANRAACEKDGGRFARGGLAGTLVCYRTPPDAGKNCATAKDCTTDCLARTRSCAPVDPLFGCNDILDRFGRVVALCRD